jgi:peptide chain release factor 1
MLLHLLGVTFAMPDERTILIDKLEDIKHRYQELSSLLNDPKTFEDREKAVALSKEQAQIRELVETYDTYTKLQEDLNAVNLLAQEEKTPETLEYLREEEDRIRNLLDQYERKLKILLLPKDPNDEKDVVVEIRAGAGGEEAAIFAADLFRMYSRYAESQGWTIEIVEARETPLGGLDPVIFEVHGKGAYSKLKYEAGVHRVQRVPETESYGRTHTSTATVAVLPEPDNVEVEIDLNKDIRIDTFNSTGPGGQSVNTTYSAVRITHLPTGIVVTCQDERSQLKNKEKALRVLKARLYQMKLAEQSKQIEEQRRSMVQSGERAEKIRTYNFKENRVTDHRINLTLYKLDQILAGDLDELITALAAAEQDEKLARLV